MKTEKKRRKIVKGKKRKGRWKIGMEVGKVIKRGEDLFFFFFFWLFTFENDGNLILKTTEICFGSTKM